MVVRGLVFGEYLVTTYFTVIPLQPEVCKFAMVCGLYHDFRLNKEYRCLDLMSEMILVPKLKKSMILVPETFTLLKLGRHQHFVRRLTNRTAGRLRLELGRKEFVPGPND